MCISSWCAKTSIDSIGSCRQNLHDSSLSVKSCIAYQVQTTKNHLVYTHMNTLSTYLVACSPACGCTNPPLLRCCCFWCKSWGGCSVPTASPRWIRMACWHHPVEYGWADVWTPWDRPQTIQQEGNYVFTRVCKFISYVHNVYFCNFAKFIDYVHKMHVCMCV